MSHCLESVGTAANCGITWWQWLSAKPNGRRPRRTYLGVRVGHTQSGHDFGMVGMAVVDKTARCVTIALLSECDHFRIYLDPRNLSFAIDNAD